MGTVSLFKTKGSLHTMSAREQTFIATKHYADLSSKPFFNGLVEYFSSGPVVAMVWEGEDAVAGGRRLVGATNPKDSAPGTIRGDLCLQVGRNIIHGSDTIENGKKEIALWFPDTPAATYTKCDEQWVYEK